MASIYEAVPRSIFSEKEPESIIRWALSVAHGRAIVSTSFGPNEAVLLHICVSQCPDIPIVWVDTGYNTMETYQVAEQLRKRLNLNLRTYHPRRSRAHREALDIWPPHINDHEAMYSFTEEVKLEPFRRALEEQAPKIWLTALRRDQTGFRESMNIVTAVEGGILKVSPLLELTEQDIEDYLEERGLPTVRDYYDPTKREARRECGLHNNLFEGSDADSGNLDFVSEATSSVPNSDHFRE